MPRPRGLSGWVTTRGTEKPASTSFSRVGTANAGVPQKTRLREAGIGRQTSDPNRFADVRGLTPDACFPYHSPAFISLRILRFMKSRLSALMWLMYSLPFR